MQSNPLRILFITATRLGDAVLSTGLLDFLRQTWPQASFTVVCGPVPAELLAVQPNVVETIALTKRRRGRHWWTLWRRVVGQRWDIVVDLRGSALAFFLRADRRHVLRGKPGADESRVRALGRILDLDPPPAPRLYPPPAAQARAAELLPPGRTVLALGATANWHAKQWPAERFRAVAERLLASDLPADCLVAVLGAPHERDSIAPLLTDWPEGRLLDLTQGEALPVLAAIAARAVLFIGNDSGLMHLAAASGCPTLGLFGPTRETAYGPWGAFGASVRTPQSAAALVGTPGFDHRTCPNLMLGLSVDEVVTAARALLQRVAAAA